jgi:hypothetical protein
MFLTYQYIVGAFSAVTTVTGKLQSVATKIHDDNKDSNNKEK